MSARVQIVPGQQVLVTANSAAAPQIVYDWTAFGQSYARLLFSVIFTTADGNLILETSEALLDDGTFADEDIVSTEVCHPGKQKSVDVTDLFRLYWRLSLWSAAAAAQAPRTAYFTISGMTP